MDMQEWDLSIETGNNPEVIALMSKLLCIEITYKI